MPWCSESFLFMLLFENYPSTVYSDRCGPHLSQQHSFLLFFFSLFYFKTNKPTENQTKQNTNHTVQWKSWPGTGNQAIGYSLLKLSSCWGVMSSFSIWKVRAAVAIVFSQFSSWRTHSQVLFSLNIPDSDYAPFPHVPTTWLHLTWRQHLHLSWHLAGIQSPKQSPQWHLRPLWGIPAVPMGHRSSETCTGQQLEARKLQLLGGVSTSNKRKRCERVNLSPKHS